MNFFISITLTILLTFLVTVVGSDKSKKIEISGYVVARDVLMPLMNTTYHNMTSELFIVRVEKPRELAEQSRYIKVSYQRWMSDPYLPDDFFESNKMWRLKVSRKPDCDGSMKKMATVNDKDTNQPVLPLPKRTPGFESEPIPLGEVLPCYVLSPKDMKSLKH